MSRKEAIKQRYERKMQEAIERGEKFVEEVMGDGYQQN